LVNIFTFVFYLKQHSLINNLFFRLREVPHQETYAGQRVGPVPPRPDEPEPRFGGNKSPGLFVKFLEFGNMQFPGMGYGVLK
jgi:hypothetical protein